MKQIILAAALAIADTAAQAQGTNPNSHPVWLPRDSLSLEFRYGA
jgi:hypothetical protein